MIARAAAILITAQALRSIGLASFQLIMIGRRRRISDDQPAGNAPRIHILLPAFSVAPGVDETIDYFRGLAIPPNVDCRVILISTDREGSVDNNPTAQAIASALRAQEGAVGPGTPAFTHLHSARKPYSKASQLNAYWESLAPDRVGDWFVVYDFDGRPELDMVRRLVRTIHDDPGSELLQQVTLTIRQPPGRAASLVARLDARGNLFRVLAYETRVFAWRDWLMRRLRLGPFASALVLPVPYCAGNGLAVSGTALESIGGFPEPVDDIGLGFRMAYLNRRMSWLPTLVPQSMYADLEAMTASKAFIYRGIGSPYSERAKILASGRADPTATLIQASKAAWAGVTWPLSPVAEVVVAIGLASSWPRRLWAYLGLVTVTQGIPLLIGQIAHRQFSRGTSSALRLNPMPVGDFLIFPIRGFANALGPWTAIVAFCRGLRRRVSDHQRG